MARSGQNGREFTAERPSGCASGVLATFSLLFNEPALEIQFFYQDQASKILLIGQVVLEAEIEFLKERRTGALRPGGEIFANPPKSTNTCIDSRLRGNDKGAKPEMTWIYAWINNAKSVTFDGYQVHFSTL